jgi:hypothetical protein
MNCKDMEGSGFGLICGIRLEEFRQIPKDMSA